MTHLSIGVIPTPNGMKVTEVDSAVNINLSEGLNTPNCRYSLSNYRS